MRVLNHILSLRVRNRLHYPSNGYNYNNNNNKSSSGNFIRFILLPFIAYLFFTIYYRLFVKLLTTTTTSTSSSLSTTQYPQTASSLSSSRQRDNKPSFHHIMENPIDEAKFIVQKSYAESYGRMMTTTTTTCSHHIIEKDCTKLIIDNIIMMKQPQPSATKTTNNTSSANNASSSNNNDDDYNNEDNIVYPWWFVTLLRDILTNGAYGPWHHFSTRGTTPPMRFCAIGKNACTEWRRVFKALNAPEFCNNNNNNKTTVDEGKEKGGSGECKSQFNTVASLSEDPRIVPNAVFIRDPLERLLSAYLDKCIKPNVRKMQGHCEPNIIFGTDYLERIANNHNNIKGNKMRMQQLEQQRREVPSNMQANSSHHDDDNDKETTTSTTTTALPDLRNTLPNREKELFAAYVDLLPLKWNVHFVPQALTCDLYRNIHTYDFVGVMGKQFMSELDRMVHRYGGDESSSSFLASVLNDTFQYQSKLHNETIAKMNLGSDNSHGTRAPSKVSKYYSARSVRRALEYLSIDYVTFGLEVPEWATEMLVKDRKISEKD